MVSEYVKKKSEGKSVEHVFTNKNRFYKVKDEHGVEHSVMVKLSCDCTFMSNPFKQDKNKICSHLYAVLKEMIR